MGDAVLRWVLAAAEQDRAHPNSQERRLAATIDRLVLTAAIRVDHLAQCERIERHRVTSEDSRARRFERPDAAERPVFPVCEERSHSVRIEGTEARQRCETCEGAGRLRCEKCRGTGNAPCWKCQGGRIQLDLTTGSINPNAISITLGACDECGGSGVKPQGCSECAGRGEIRHLACRGDGSVTTWEEDTTIFSVVRDRRVLLPPEGQEAGLYEVVNQILEDAPALSSLSRETASSVPGFESPEAHAAIRAAVEVGTDLRARVEAGEDQCLFLVPQYRVVPVAGCFVESEQENRRSQFWVIGDGPGAAVVTRDSAEESPWYDTALSLLRSPPPPIPLVVLVPCGDAPAELLSLLATLGAFTQRFEVVDRQYRERVLELAGDSGLSGQSRTVLIRLLSGKLVRLLEVADRSEIPPEEWSRLEVVASAVVPLNEGGEVASLRTSLVNRATDVDWGSRFDALWQPIAAALPA